MVECVSLVLLVLLVWAWWVDRPTWSPVHRAPPSPPDDDLPLVYREDGQPLLSIKNSPNAQTFRLYNTYTGTGSYERLQVQVTPTTLHTADCRYCGRPNPQHTPTCDGCGAPARSTSPKPPTLF